MDISPQVIDFLALIRFSEGTSTSSLTKNDGYDVIVTGVDGPEIFTDYTDHPFIDRPAKLVNNHGLKSTASGGYQFLCTIWKSYQGLLRLPDFSPSSQDAAAVQILRERKALPLIEAGSISGAITRCSNIWASLPGNNYGQNPHSMEKLLARWEAINSA